jgi:hypothetical protein
MRSWLLVVVFKTKLPQRLSLETVGRRTTCFKPSFQGYQMQIQLTKTQYCYNLLYLL